MVLRKTKNEKMFLQFTLAAYMLEDFRRKIHRLMDEFVILSKSSSDKLGAICRFREFRVEYNFRFHPEKCMLYIASVFNDVVALEQMEPN